MPRFNITDVSRDQLQAINLVTQQAIGPASDSVMELHTPNGDVVFRTLKPIECDNLKKAVIRFLAMREF